MNRKSLSLLLSGVVMALAMLAPSASVQAQTTSSTALTSSSTSVAAPARWIGFYQPGAPQYVGPLDAVEAELGAHVQVTNFFRSVEQPFTDREVSNAVQNGSIPLITLEICGEGDSCDVSQPNYTMAKIAAGAIDPTLLAYAQDAKATGHEIWIRPFHEMNGSWYPWCGTTNGNSPAQCVAAWRHVHDVFVQAGATNVKFVWCPNIESIPNTGANAIANYWPGDDYVDYIALDGYNFSTTLPSVHWRSFTSLFAGPYATVCALSATKPIFIAETASVSQGGNKPAWIADMFRVIPQSFPRVVGVDWFNSDSGGRDWPVDSSSAALQSFRLGMANGTYSPGLQLSPVRTTISIKSNVKSVRRHHPFKVSGVLTPGQYHDRVRVIVGIPRHRGSHKDVYTNGAAGWSLKYTPTVKGTYYVRVTYGGDSNRFAGASKTIKIVVK